MAQFKAVIRTLMVVIVIAFCSTTFYYYNEQGKARAEALIPTLPDFEHTNNQQFLDNVIQCVNYIEHNTTDIYPVNLELLLAQAALESGWGNSRFAVQGNNLFGIRTWTESTPHLLPQGIEKWPGWGVRAFASKCDSVKEYVRLLNNHNAYKEFREMRAMMLSKNQQLDSFQLIKTLDKFSTTPDYDKRVIRMIKKIRKLEEKK